MKNKMTPTPWEEHKDIHGEPCVVADTDKVIGQQIISMRGDVDKFKGNVNAIVSAVNATYGNSIHPSSVKDMYEALEFFVNWAERQAAWDKTDQSYYKAKAALKLAKIK